MHNNTNTTTNTNNNNGKNNHHHHHHYYNNFPPLPVSISPRISFSNDFVESQGNGGRGSAAMALRQEPRVPHCPDAAVGSSDFEFSVSKHNMMSADELFFKGRILPSFRGTKTTLREELLVEEEEGEEEEGVEVLERRPARGAGGGSSAVGRWKGFLGLRKGGKKGDSSNKCEGAGDRAFDNNSSSQEMMNDGVVNKFK
ncbi:hypothetical protein MLD38_028588 [Melastoma candidum]|uniref:Uncharacterized protein n=1 Tax=Melastoma candidum TaxID=119954 RepID=A0ACB9N2S6_9MYRT|nr:hypothetical protein MLD38_028588 [Melastoma candidum]